ncbi:nitrous oxide-stimulated promoter family protein [Isachenkonia alkalipeptolytica]|uniref:Nitrous oxide-stimulated promoter family protein n=1 Tax=Isachenkonia alkalipeptolytica TaxID=2565777 RepID=A0AA43XMQ4_9CLOT|nr:nitrous oxide-stimulated promoter family protein [Isachenkonia alkalipeptolytica]NBG89678.1 nitrous oxide-stimulated promoter family protein [Isachenkonia alkalipeptolytica]
MGKIHREKRIVADMIRFYCDKKHPQKKDLCKHCSNLLDYAHKRLENCPYGEKKTSCRRCLTHCYNPDMRMAIKRVMGYGAPRMFFYKPAEWIKHLFS